MPKLVECEQGSAEWLQARCGRITASRLADVMDYKEPSSAKAKQSGFTLVREAVAAGIKGDESQKRIGFRMDLVAERLTRLTEPYYVSPEMKWGTKHEPMARALYEVATGSDVDQIGFAIHPTMDFSGASPDALVDSDGGLEIKCPKTTTHLGYMMAGVVPEDYIPQMMWNMVCCERLWWDFVSYDPRLEDAGMHLFCVRLDYDQAEANRMASEVRKFNDEIEVAIDGLRQGRLAA